MIKDPYILYIEDERSMIDLVHQAMKFLGYKVVGALSGKQGLAMIRERKPDLLLLDLMMPDFDGQQTLAQLKQVPETAHIPVIMLTAKVQASKLELMGKGAAGVLVKPFDPMQLPNRVCEILGWSAADGKEIGHSGSARE